MKTKRCLKPISYSREDRPAIFHMQRAVCAVLLVATCGGITFREEPVDVDSSKSHSLLVRAPGAVSPHFHLNFHLSFHLSFRF